MPQTREPLTIKQKKFVQEYIKSGNGRIAVLRSYDTKNDIVARNIASVNLKKPNVQEELQKALNKREARLDRVVDNITNISLEKPVKGYSGSEILEANKTLLKLHGVLTDKKQTYNYTINTTLKDLSISELIERRNKLKEDTDNILKT